ncbi:MAG: SMP-30/gluconolactonase/LRE family protein [Candidatus Methylacidiphilales bacterium]|nr:SMP-30/gluconolactonase/LRE family protein [Candidatus Methylacidiphilales bacterium]
MQPMDLAFPLLPRALSLCLAAFACSLAGSYAQAPGPTPAPGFGIERLDPALDSLLAPDAGVENLASGFKWAEGPLWKQGSVWFSDVPANTVYQWKEGDPEASIALKPSGDFHGGSQGSNGLALEASGRLLLCQHGERQVARLEPDGTFTALATHFEGKRFNSPNDLTLARDGTLFFTDPPYGLGKATPPELDFHGVYALSTSGSLRLLIRDLRFPNGIALSPDEKTLYVAVSDPANSRIMAYHLDAEGRAVDGREFFAAQSLKSPERKGGCDGLKIDRAGNLWATGPGGVLILSPQGKHLGTILTGKTAANCAFGGPERDTLYITATNLLLRVKTLARGL